MQNILDAALCVYVSYLLLKKSATSKINQSSVMLATLDPIMQHSSNGSYRGTRNVLCYVSNCLHCDASFAYSSTNYSGLISSYTCVGMVSTLVSDVFVSHSCGTS